MSGTIEQVGTELAIQSGIRDAVSALRDGSVNIFSSIAGSDFESKLKTLAAVTNSEAVVDHIDEVILLRHVVIQVVEINNEATGELVDVPRVILIDDDGKAYHAVSQGLFKAVENFIGTLGMPDEWPSALPIRVKRERARVGYFFTIELAL